MKTNEIGYKIYGDVREDTVVEFKYPIGLCINSIAWAMLNESLITGSRPILLQVASHEQIMSGDKTVSNRERELILRYIERKYEILEQKLQQEK